jgi:hypothetical protein
MNDVELAPILDLGDLEIIELEQKNAPATCCWAACTTSCDCSCCSVICLPTSCE